MQRTTNRRVMRRGYGYRCARQGCPVCGAAVNDRNLAKKLAHKRLRQKAKRMLARGDDSVPIVRACTYK